MIEIVVFTLALQISDPVFESWRNSDNLFHQHYYTCSGGRNWYIFRDPWFGYHNLTPSKRSYQQLLKVQSRLMLSEYRPYCNAVLYLSADKSRVTVGKQLTNWHFQNISEHRNTAPSDHRGLGTTVVLASTPTSVKTTTTLLKEIKNRKSLHVQLYYKVTRNNNTGFTVKLCPSMSWKYNVIVLHYLL